MRGPTAHSARRRRVDACAQWRPPGRSTFEASRPGLLEERDRSNPELFYACAVKHHSRIAIACGFLRVSITTRTLRGGALPVPRTVAASTSETFAPFTSRTVNTPYPRHPDRARPEIGPADKRNQSASAPKLTDSVSAMINGCRYS